jgi:mono/diheme cytochrome c family protein
MSTTRTIPSATVALLVLTACGGADPAAPVAPAAKPPAPAAATGEAQARELFNSLCSTCHGTTGRGDGPGAIALDPKPRSFGDSAWQTSVTDEHIQKVIVFGGAAVGKSPMMPAQPQLKGQQEVLQALVRIVRAFDAGKAAK